MNCSTTTEGPGLAGEALWAYEVDAVWTYAAANGRAWRARLRRSWATGVYRGVTSAQVDALWGLKDSRLFNPDFYKLEV